MLFYKTDFSAIVSSLKKANYLLVAPSLAVYFISFWFKVVRWSFIISPLKQVSSRRLFSINVIGYMVNNLLPGRIGELVRAYMVGKKENISKSAVLGTIIVERIFDGLALIFITLLFSLIQPLDDFLKKLLAIMTSVFIGLFLLSILMVSFPAAFQKGIDRLFLFIPQKYRNMAKRIMGGMFEGMRILNKPGRLAIIFLYSLLLWSLEAITGYIVGISFGLEMPYSIFFISTGAANLAAALPTTQGGIGPYEYFAKQTLVIFGADNSLAIAYAIVLHATLILPLTFLGLVYLWSENLSLSGITLPALQKKESLRK